MRRRDSGGMVGMFFIGLVLVALFSSGAAGVLATRTAGPSESSRPSASAIQLAERAEVTARFEQIMRVRQRALLTLDTSLLRGIYTPDSPQLRKDSIEIQKLRRKSRRWVDMKLPVSVLQARADSSRRWTVVALLGRSTSRLETKSGQLIKEVAGARQVYWCSMVKDPGKGWLLYELTPPESLQLPS